MKLLDEIKHLPANERAAILSTALHNLHDQAQREMTVDAHDIECFVEEAARPFKIARGGG